MPTAAVRDLGEVSGNTPGAGPPRLRVHEFHRLITTTVATAQLLLHRPDRFYCLERHLRIAVAVLAGAARLYRASPATFRDTSRPHTHKFDAGATSISTSGLSQR